MTLLKLFRNKYFPNNRQKTFDSLMSTAHKIAKENPAMLTGLVRLIARGVQTKIIMECLECDKEISCEDFTPDNILFKDMTDGQYKNKLKGHFTVKLSSDPVLPWPWEKEKLKKCFQTIGENCVSGDWKEIKEDHQVELWFPIGICWVVRGNHSIAVGVIKCTGEVTIGGNCSSSGSTAYDISPAYEHFKCDGQNFYDIKGSKLVGPVKYPEMAAIFEIGKLMVSRNISALGDSIVRT